MLKKRQITLDFIYDDEKVNDPANWDWYDLISPADSELMEVSNCGKEPMNLTEEDIEKWKQYKDDMEGV